MARYQVEAEFVSAERPDAAQLAELRRLLSIHGGDVFGRLYGWRASVFVAMSPSAPDAGFDAAEIMRSANVNAGLPLARMTDITVHQVGAAPLPPAEGESRG